MSIASEISRLQGVKSDILTAISNKGVTVPTGSALDDCPGLIASISGVDKFSNSPNMSVLQLSDQIQYGRVTNTSGIQGVFIIPEFPYDSYNNIERNMKFVINAWNTDGNAYSGDYWTGNPNSRTGACLFYYQDKIEVFNGFVLLETITGVSLAIGDEIEENVYIDRVANSLMIKIYKNGSLFISKTYQNQSISIGTRQFYVLGLRFSPPSGHNSKSTFIFSGSWIKADGSLIWGLE